MNRSSTRILTTHVGSLPGLARFDPTAPDYDETLRAGVAEIVKQQLATGLDIINEGEYTKGGDWLSYVDNRFASFEARPPAGGKSLILQGKGREEFADFYRYASERGTPFYEPGGQIKHSQPHWVATSSISYRGAAEPPLRRFNTHYLGQHAPKRADAESARKLREPGLIDRRSNS